MRLTKTLLACALALSSIPSFADALLSFEVGDSGAPNGSTPTVDAPPMLLDGTSFGGFNFNGNGAWLTSSTPAGCPAGGLADFFTHAPDATHAGGGCGALNLTSELDLRNVDGLPHELVITSPFGFTSFEFWWSTKGGNFTVKFLNAAGEVESPARDHGGNDSCQLTVGNYCTWHLETVTLAKAATQVVFNYGTDDAFAMIDDLKFIAPRDGGNGVPEPASLALVLAALGGVGLSRRRAAKKA
jgi:hypothetical protein